MAKITKKETFIPKKKNKKVVPSAIAYINSTFNNTIITITDPKGDVICWSSSGAIGFKGAKKSTPYAAQLVAQKVAKKAKEFGVETLSIRINGIGPGRNAALKQFQSLDFKLAETKNITPVPHNGVKKPKKLRRK